MIDSFNADYELYFPDDSTILFQGTLFYSTYLYLYLYLGVLYIFLSIDFLWR